MKRQSLHSIKKKVIGRKPLSWLLAGCFPGFFAQRLRNPVFIIGCARSGTTFLTSLLSLHRDVDNWSEANEIWDPGGHPWHLSHRETLPLVFDPVSFTNRWWRDAQPRQKQLRAIFGAYQWLSRKPYFLNKAPSNTFRIPNLLRMFPEARFIHLVRDGRAVGYSYALKEYVKMQEAPDSYQAMGLQISFEDLAVQLGTFWKKNIEEVDRQNEALELTRKGILIELTYEELCNNTGEVLSRICRYLGLETSRFAPALKQELRVTTRNQKWQQALDAHLITRMVTAMEPVLTAKGYV
jgi:Sulfotransferase family